MHIPRAARLVLVRRRHKLVSVTTGYRSFSTKHDAFKILFFGRDEFSCGVLQQVLKAKGFYVIYVLYYLGLTELLGHRCLAGDPDCHSAGHEDR